jgi:acetyl esterase
MRLVRGLAWLVLATAGLPAVAAGAVPSTGGEHLRRWQQRFPDADYDRDGVLTPAEAWRYQGEEPQRNRAAQAKRQQAIAEAQKAGRPPPPEPPRLAPHQADVRYGPHERNVLDLWLAKSDRPTPLVIFYHGGAWKIGDKRDVQDATVQACLAAGISVAAVNYSFTTTAPLPAPHLDSARALQFLRANAGRWNLDPERVAAYGSSAGAMISLWLAFHPDLADSRSDDPVARESTRLTCAGSINGQCTIDPFMIREWIGEPAFQHTVFLAAFGVKTHAELGEPRFRPLIDEMSPLTHLTADDVPVFQSYREPDAPLPPDAKRGQGMHHPVFGHKLKAAMDRLGLECGYVHVVDIPGDPELEMIGFFRRQFGIP